MDSIILAGGYARRLHPTTLEIPKPLLPITGVPLLSYTIRKLNDFYTENDGTCYLTVNRRHRKDFENFLDREECTFPIKLVVEDSEKESEKPGPIAAMFQAFRDHIQSSSPEGVLVLAGDGLSSIDLSKLKNYHMCHIGNSTIALYDIGDFSMASGYGCAEVGPLGSILSFEEKPEKPKSTFVNTTYFILTPDNLASIGSYLKSGLDEGHIKWLLERGIKLKGLVFDGYWFDIGDHESLQAANQMFREDSI